MNKKFESVDEYMAEFPKATQVLIMQMRKGIKQAAPKAEELISYNIPSYKLDGLLVHFAAYAKHIGFYPGTAAIIKFKPKLKRYRCSKGAVQFPIDETLPMALVKEITEYRIREQMKKLELKQKVKGKR